MEVRVFACPPIPCFAVGSISEVTLRVLGCFLFLLLSCSRHPDVEMAGYRGRLQRHGHGVARPQFGGLVQLLCAVVFIEDDSATGRPVGEFPCLVTCLAVLLSRYHVTRLVACFVLVLAVYAVVVFPCCPSVQPTRVLLLVLSDYERDLTFHSC